MGKEAGFNFRVRGLDVELLAVRHHEIAGFIWELGKRDVLVMERDVIEKEAVDVESEFVVD